VRAVRLAAVVVALAFGTLAASRTRPAPLARPLEPAAVLTLYAQALASASRPSAIEFDYSVEQLGPHTLEQTHHVYRSGQGERDEITGVDGQLLSRPSVRILLNRHYPYDVRSLAPHPGDYTFTYVGTLLEGADHFVYLFKTEGHATDNFSVDEIGIDGISFLPATLHFRIAGESSHGSGQLSYAQFDRYWLVREATVAVHLTNGILAQERITWSKYQFPPSLPASTFNEPHGSPTPAATP